ncbi:hypothetical protein O6H91_03G113200 [Diphasiastrum complanatum]|uniref:Uncharacterized protein n=1 Tax=Diphasiastrum complanatum TaxID=34168 RepID=A0ACC2EA64_DIPCM|nr:hypothetical protein O6H91_03G113200 [Diphasiastrum complanatum]
MRPFFRHLSGFLKPKFTVLKLWEADDQQVFLKENADTIRGLIGSSGSGVSAELIDALPNLEIDSCFSVGIDKVEDPIRRRRKFCQQ